jgi:hypothetical protein
MAEVGIKALNSAFDLRSKSRPGNEILIASLQHRVVKVQTVCIALATVATEPRLMLPGYLETVVDLRIALLHQLEVCEHFFASDDVVSWSHVLRIKTNQSEARIVAPDALSSVRKVVENGSHFGPNRESAAMLPLLQLHSRCQRFREQQLRSHLTAAQQNVADARHSGSIFNKRLLASLDCSDSI